VVVGSGRFRVPGPSSGRATIRASEGGDVSEDRKFGEDPDERAKGEDPDESDVEGHMWDQPEERAMGEDPDARAMGEDPD